MAGQSGYEAESEASPPSSGSEISLAERKKPCEICGSNANEDKILTCFMCRDTREHTYCARVMLQPVPRIWLCEECRGFSSIVQVVNNEDRIDQTATSSRSSYQVVDNEVLEQNMTTSDSSNQMSATHQPSQPHASPVVDEASSPVPMDTSPVKLPDLNLKLPDLNLKPLDLNHKLPDLNLPADSESEVV